MQDEIQQQLMALIECYRLRCLWFLAVALSEYQRGICQLIAANRRANAVSPTAGHATAQDRAPLSYTPKHLADKILTTRSTLHGERKPITVLFADVASFSTLADRLDPEDVHTLMDGCFAILTEQVHTYEGTINQFTGDGIMALFGAPIAHEDHAVRALSPSRWTTRSFPG